jgi:thiol-disulfide isomerase/thioredoxin
MSALRRVCLVPLVGLALAGAPAAAEELTPERWEKMNQLFQRAGGQYQKREYQKAVESYLELLKLIPPGAGYERMRLQSHYSLAGSYALLAMEKEALHHLEQAVEHGLTDPRNLDRNPDFAQLRLAGALEGVRERMRLKVEEQRRKAEEEARRRLEPLRSFDFSVTTLDGKTITKKDFLGQVLIVDIWGTWCGPCLMELPHFVELHKRYGEKGLKIVGLSSERVRDRKEAERLVRECVQRYKVPYPCALAPDEVLRAIPNFRAFPTTLFFGRDGTPRALEEGMRGLEALEAIVKPLLAEPPPRREQGPREAADER